MELLITITLLALALTFLAGCGLLVWGVVLVVRSLTRGDLNP